jgi:hypothetical protein
MRYSCLLAILLLSATCAVTQERVLGLLTLPEVFGDGACHEFVPREVVLFAAPGSEELIGSIRVAEYWTFHERGGCEGLRVRVYGADGSSAGDLPTQEFEYEAPAAIVLGKQGRWFRLRLSEGAAWVRASEHNQYYPLEVLLPDRLTYVTADSERTMFDRPAGTDVVAMASVRDSVRVVDFARDEEQLWLLVEVLSHSVCESADEVSVISRGWMRAHGPGGLPAVWYYSRGC